MGLNVSSNETVVPPQSIKIFPQLHTQTITKRIT